MVFVEVSHCGVCGGESLWCLWGLSHCGVCGGESLWCLWR